MELEKRHLPPDSEISEIRCAGKRRNISVSKKTTTLPWFLVHVYNQSKPATSELYINEIEEGNHNIFRGKILVVRIAKMNHH